MATITNQKSDRKSTCGNAMRFFVITCPFGADTLLVDPIILAPLQGRTTIEVQNSGADSVYLYFGNP